MERQERQRWLAEYVRRHPLVTDEELARQLKVSVPTVRLDRMALGIPELRRRTEGLAQRAIEGVRSLGREEMVGELIELELGRYGSSRLVTDLTMAFARTGVVRGHYLFAQADSLAIAVINGDVVLTGLANAKFKRPVMAGEELVARAEVIRRERQRAVVLVVTQSGSDVVFRAKFVVFALDPYRLGGKSPTVAGDRTERGPEQA
ncbi:MAG: transcription factor FapR [Firmicutes bacterium]|nr:transcription factor FapR [Bacillota bacterium]